MTSIVTPNQTAYWEMKVAQLKFEKLELLKALEKLVGQARNGSDEETLQLALIEAKNVIDRVTNHSPPMFPHHPQGDAQVSMADARADEHRNDVVATLVSITNKVSPDQAKTIYDAIALIEGDSG